MAFDLNKELVLHKIGKGYLKTKSGNFNEVTYGQKMSMDVKATLVDVKGGNSLFPIYTFVSGKEGTITIDSATFSLSQSSIANQVNITTASLKKVNRLLLASTATSLGTYTGVVDVNCISPSGVPVTVTNTGSAPVDTAGVDVSATGAILWGSAVVAGEYKFWFKSDAPTEAASMGMLKNAMPEVSEFVWTIEGAELDGDTYQIDIYASRVRADGTFKIDLAKDTASVPQLVLKVLDPGDGSENFATIVMSKIA